MLTSRTLYDPDRCRKIAARILAGEGPRQFDPARAPRQVGIMLALHPLKVLGEGVLGHDGRMVMRSLAPLPSRTTIWFIPKSMSWTAVGSIRASARRSHRAGSP
jgi:hypothetical protein